MTLRRVVVVIAALVASGCGVRLQQQPEAIDRAEVPYGLLDEANSGRADRIAFVVYLARGERLVAVPRVTRAAATPEVVVEELLRGPTFDEAAAGLSSAIPAGTRLLATARDGAVVTIDLGAELGGASDLAAALRQLEATLLELPGVDLVRVLIEGAEVPAAGG